MKLLIMKFPLVLSLLPSYVPIFSAFFFLDNLNLCKIRRRVSGDDIDSSRLE